MMRNVLKVAALSSLIQLFPMLAVNEATPILIQQDLYFGRNIGTTEGVTEQEFQRFLEDVVALQLPVDIVEYDAQGQFLDNDGDLIRERSKVLTVVYEPTTANQQAIHEIVRTYQQRFRQESVLQVENRDIAIGFGQGEDLINNDPAPELIQVDLYFGQNVGTTRQVSDRQFSQFLANVVTPSFPNGLTVYNAEKQSLDRSNGLMQEPSKVVSLIIEDTETNEQLLYQVIDAYKHQFQQQFVLTVVNEEVKAEFEQTEDLIDNDIEPELIQVDLHFGQNIGISGQVSDCQFDQFLHDQVTPRFPDGLTVYDTSGQFLDSKNRLIYEPGKVVSLILEDTQVNEDSINQIISAYKQQFQQESVLAVVDESLSIAFDVRD